MPKNEPPEVNKLFKSAKSKLRAHIKSNKTAKKQLFSALAHIFELGIKLINSDMTEAFVKEHDQKLWNKTAAKKPYHPLVQLVFGETNRTSQSQYSTLLQYCHDLGWDEHQFSSELQNQGLTTLYNLAADAKRNLEFYEFEASVLEQELWAKTAVDNRSPLFASKLSMEQAASLPTHKGYQQAYIRVADGELQILKSVPVSTDQIEAAVLKIAGQPPKFIHDRLKKKNLYQLFLACDWITKFPTSAAMESIDEKGTTPNSFDGFEMAKIESGWSITSTGTSQNFQCVELKIEDELAVLNPKEKYVFSAANCSKIASSFLTNSDWEVDNDTNGPFIENLSDHTKLRFENTADLKKLDLKSVNSSRKNEATFVLSKAKLAELKNWKAQHLKDNQSSKFVSLIQLNVENGILIASMPNSPLIKKEIAEVKSRNANLSNDLKYRYIKQSSIEALANAANEYDVDYDVTIFSVYEKSCGLECNSVIDDSEITIFIPLCVSKNGDLAQITLSHSSRQ